MWLLLLLSAESRDRAVCASLLLLPTLLCSLPSPGTAPAQGPCPARTQPTLPGSPHLAGLTRTPPARLAAGSCQTAAGSPCSQPRTRRVCEHACMHTCSAAAGSAQSHSCSSCPETARGCPCTAPLCCVLTASWRGWGSLWPCSLAGLPTGHPPFQLHRCDTLPGWLLCDGGTQPAPHCPTASPSPWQGTEGTGYPTAHTCLIAPITPARWQSHF